ncbi:hypothetical protein MELA_00905 [Candidatus Methylomirabilis lanthanidiphila]|uniref:Uncharacterized protein n=1 Tax=Candidatus Methylomirabilis lanthanidiphila TaxID=2211376 RepID=A0A564ZIR5_9BACT|nr:hypothetical protein [Candidatus Methylomirabilis lanthanidiphila]VUZ84532.1 hypothetical protein MELA_00905 [Candidatus Methylomirabilis lanthanidiphila]
MRIAEGVTLVSPTLDAERARQIIKNAEPFLTGQHLAYPSDRDGAQVHLEAYFATEAIVQCPESVSWLVEDVVIWMRAKDLRPTVIFAPGTEPVRRFVEKLSRAVHAISVYLETKPSGRFGDTIEGSIPTDASVLTFNLTSLTGGRCVGFRLPDAAARNGGHVVGTGAIALGASSLNEALRRRFPDNLYIAFHVAVTNHNPDACPANAPRLRPWQEASADIIARLRGESI